jgi:hypothetical protein
LFSLIGASNYWIICSLLLMFYFYIFIQQNKYKRLVDISVGFILGIFLCLYSAALVQMRLLYELALFFFKTGNIVFGLVYSLPLLSIALISGVFYIGVLSTFLVNYKD